jgi:prepilin-type N-terminal cleavage/methylation domain-containing protein
MIAMNTRRCRPGFTPLVGQAFQPDIVPERQAGKPDLRRAFTLIELLVVIAIIAVLVSLTAAAVQKVRSRGVEVQARSEIGQLETALAACRTDFSLDAVPSRLVLREDGRYDRAGPNRALYPQTITLLQKMFGRGFNTAGRYDWNGSGTLEGGELVLEGQHCLVFFLGGIPTPPGGTDGCTGFGTDKANPTAPGGTRHGPYYEFKANRLRRDANGFFIYLDPWRKQPYAYFSATKAGNDYTRDCPTLRVVPYFDLSRRFLNPNGNQILSAGPDKVFGPGGMWDPAAGYAGGDGADDLSNFSQSPLGVRQQ